MAEIQKTTQSGETAQRFIEFVMMQAQNASLFLGLIPNPGTGEPEVNLDLARMFIDQLGMIGEKTRGNLSSDEEKVLRNCLSNLQMAYYEVAQGKGPVPGGDGGAPQEPLPTPTDVRESAAAEPTADAPSSSPDSGESRKRFTKSYGS